MSRFRLGWEHDKAFAKPIKNHPCSDTRIHAAAVTRPTHTFDSRLPMVTTYVFSHEHIGEGSGPVPVLGNLV